MRSPSPPSASYTSCTLFTPSVRCCSLIGRSKKSLWILALWSHYQNFVVFPAPPLREVLPLNVLYIHVPTIHYCGRNLRSAGLNSGCASCAIKRNIFAAIRENNKIGRRRRRHIRTLRVIRRRFRSIGSGITGKGGDIQGSEVRMCDFVGRNDERLFTHFLS